MKHAISFLFFCCSWLAISQETATQGILTLDRIFNSSDFAQEHFGPHKWLAGGAYYTTVEYNDFDQSELVLYHSETGERTLLIKAEELLDPSTQEQIEIEDYSWSDDERTALIFTRSQRVWRDNTRGDYYIHNLQSKLTKRIGQGLDESSLMFAKFNPAGTQIAYVSSQNIYVEDVQSGERRQLTTDGNVDIINGTFDWAYEEEFFCKDGFRWSPDGQSIAFWQMDARNTRDFFLINNTADVYSQIIPIQYPKVGQIPSSAKVGIINIPTGNIEWIEVPGDPFEHYIPRIQWLAKTDQLLITQLSRKQNHLILWIYQNTNKSLVKVYEEQSTSWIDIVNIDVSAAWQMEDVIVLEEGKSFIWVSEKDGWRHLYKMGVDGQKNDLISPGDYDIASIKGIDREQKNIYVMASPENATQRYLFALNIETGKLKRMTPAKFTGLNSYEISPSGSYAVHRHQNSNTPSSAYVINLTGHVVKDILYENEPLKKALLALDLPEVEFFKITTADGIELDGKMIKPANFDATQKYPVLFEVYGEPAGQTAVAAMDDLWHLYLVQQGLIVMTLDNRGTPSLKGATWRKSIYRNIGIINVRDQALAAQEILKWDFIDAKRIGVWGWSGGGAMTLNLMFKYPDIYKMGIAVAAVTNQLFYDNIYQERYMGLPSENLEDFVKGSPATHVAGLEGHLLYIHGTGDDNVHYQNAEFLINALIRENKAFDLMIYPNRSHGIYEGQNTSRHLYSTMTNYVKKYLLPEKN